MLLSLNGKLEICQYEGMTLMPYLDTENVWTIGIGHTHNDIPPNPSTMNPNESMTIEEVINLFLLDIKKYEDRVNKYITSPLTQNQFDSLVSFDYNTGGISNSTVTNYVNSGKSASFIEHAFMMWIANKELVTRRENEKNLFLYGEYTNKGKMILYKTNGKGRISMQGAKLINIKEYLI